VAAGHALGDENGIDHARHSGWRRGHALGDENGIDRARHSGWRRGHALGDENGLIARGTVGGGAGMPSAWIVPLFQVGSVEELLTGTAMDSRIRLTESAATRTSRLFFTGTLLVRKGASSQSGLVSAWKKVLSAEHRFKQECPDAR